MATGFESKNAESRCICNPGVGMVRMRRTSRLRFASIMSAAIAGLLLMRITPVAGQEVTAPALKAAFIYNFAKFTEWPVDMAPGTGPIFICVLGDAAVAEALERAVKRRMVAGHSISVSLVAPTGPPGVCHILYVAGVPPRQAAQVVGELRDVPVLTISDLDGFTDAGGIVQLFFEHGQLRFGIDYESAKRARLQISSSLFALARRK
jgi:hypothetical protein